MICKTNRKSTTGGIELLESRRLLSGSLSGSVVSAELDADGLLTVSGTRQADNIVVSSLQDTGRVQVKAGDEVISIESGDQTFDDLDPAAISGILVKGRGGNDTITIDDANGALAPATLKGCDGNDVLTGGNENDLLVGGNGKDHLIGNGGDDQLEGGNGKDTLDGGDGKDSLFGSNGKDVLDGGADDDQLNGGNGKDELTGGLGTDQFNDRGDDILDQQDDDAVLQAGKHRK